jgi:hypothetical protein
LQEISHPGSRGKDPSVGSFTASARAMSDEDAAQVATRISGVMVGELDGV